MEKKDLKEKLQKLSAEDFVCILSILPVKGAVIFFKNARDEMIPKEEATKIREELMKLTVEELLELIPSPLENAVMEVERFY